MTFPRRDAAIVNGANQQGRQLLVRDVDGSVNWAKRNFEIIWPGGSMIGTANSIDSTPENGSFVTFNGMLPTGISIPDGAVVRVKA